jgi:uncharacterized protein (DUF2062 family)
MCAAGRRGEGRRLTVRTQVLARGGIKNRALNVCSWLLAAPAAVAAAVAAAAVMGLPPWLPRVIAGGS